MQFLISESFIFLLFADQEMQKVILLGIILILSSSVTFEETEFPKEKSYLRCDRVVTDNVNYACYDCGQKFEEPADQLKCITDYLNLYYKETNWQAYWYDPRGTCGTVGALDFLDDCYQGYESTFVWRSPKDRTQQSSPQPKKFFGLRRENLGCDASMTARAYNFISTCTSGSMGEQLKCIQTGLNSAYPETRWQALSFRPICGAVYQFSIINECKVEASTGDFNIVVWRYI